MMHRSNLLSSTLALCAAASLAAAETIVINAGNLYFEPQNVNASVGDVLEFHFLPNNHSVVEGDLTDPCAPAATGGFYSGFLPVSSGENAEVFRVTINDTDPIVYYCSQNASSHNHCKGGMIGFVNQANETAIQTYQDAAASLDINISPDGGVFGGLLAANPNTTAAAAANSTTAGDGAGGSSSSTASASGKGTATSASPSASGTLVDSSGADVMSVGSGVLALLMALMAA